MTFEGYKMSKRVLIKLRQSWLTIVNIVKIGGLQMAIMSKKVDKKCKICLLFALMCCLGCKSKHISIDEEIRLTCIETQKEIEKYVQIDSSKTISIIRTLERKYPNSSFVKVNVAIAYAELYHYWNEDSLAISYARQNLGLAVKNRFYNEQIHLYLILIETTEDYKEALDYFEKVEFLLEIQKQIYDPILIFRYYFLFGYYYYEIRDYNNAKSNFNKSLLISRKSKLLWEESKSLNALSVIFDNDLMFKQALQYVNEAIKIGKKISPMNCGGYYYQKGVILNNLKRFSEAEEAVLEAKKCYRIHPHPYNPEILESVLGEIYLNQKKYKEAGDNYRSFLEKAKHESTKVWAYNLLSNYYFEVKDYKNAYIINKKCIKLRDSIFSTERTFFVVQKRTDFELAKKELEIKETQVRLKFSVGIIVCIIISILIFIRLSRRNDLLMRQLAKVNEEKLQQEIEFEQRRLALSTLQLSQHNDALKNLKKDIENLHNFSPELIKEQTKSIVKSLESDLNIDNEWDKFKLHFESVSPHFFERLKARNNQLTDLDLKHCAYLKMNLTPKQVAQILGVSPKSVTLSRVRIKKKLQLPEEEPLSVFLQKN